MNSGERYFDVFMEYRFYHDNIRDKAFINLVPCYKEQWESRGYGDAFDRLNLTKWMCPPDGTSI